MDLAAPQRWHIRLLSPAAAALLSVTVAMVGGSRVAAAPRAYTALGDSYSSGQGTHEYYRDGTNCKRSPYAYPVLDAARLGASLTFAACGGATTTDVLNSQLDSLSATTAYVTLSIGGNDAGFARVLTLCSLPSPAICKRQIEAAGRYITSTLPARLDAVYTRIRGLASRARVVVVGYPRLFNGKDCDAVAGITPASQSLLNEAADLLATTIQARAIANGFAFVDARSAFTGHAVCDLVEWINGLSDPLSESYHPNRDGQAGYADIVGLALRARPAA